MAGTSARRKPARKVRNNPSVLPATPLGRQGPHQTGGVFQYGIQSSNQTGQTPQYGIQGSYSTGAISQYGNPHGHGTASQSTPPRFFGNVPLYISSEPPPHGHVHGAPTHQEPQERKSPNVLRADAQSFYPRIAQNVLPLDPARLMPNPLQVGSSGSVVANNPVPLDFSQVQIFSAASSPFVPNSLAIPYTPFTPFYPAQLSVFPGNQQLSPLNLQLPNVNSLISALARFSLLSKQAQTFNKTKRFPRWKTTLKSLIRFLLTNTTQIRHRLRVQVIHPNHK